MTYLIADDGLTPESFHERMAGTLPGHLGFEVTSVARDRFNLSLDVQAHHLAPNGFLHGGTVVALADTAAGFLSVVNLREGQGFTTIELKTNYFATARRGVVEAHATPLHMGRTTHVIDVTVSDRDAGKRLALFRCTNLVLA